MQVIVKSFDQYYVRCTDENGAWNEVYNPRAATVFPSKKAAKEWIDREPEMSDHLEIVTDIDGAIETFEEWLEGGMVRRHFDGPSNYNILFDSAKHDAMDVLKWNYQYAVDGDSMRISQDVYSSWSNQIWHHFNFIQDFQGFYSLDYTEKYVSFEIKVDRDSSFEDFKKELNMVIDNFELTHLNEDGALIIDIFEHDLCATRHMVLLMEDRVNDKWSIEDIRYSFRGKDLDSVSLKKCFDLIQKRYYND